MNKNQKKADAAARKRAERQRKETAGLIRLELWAKPEHHGAIRDFARGLSDVGNVESKV